MWHRHAEVDCSKAKKELGLDFIPPKQASSSVDQSMDSQKTAQLLEGSMAGHARDLTPLLLNIFKQHCARNHLMQSLRDFAERLFELGVIQRLGGGNKGKKGL
jgi:hypothetical protein